VSKMEKEYKNLRMEIAIKVIIMMENFTALVIFILYRCVYLGKPIKILRIVQKRLQKWKWYVDFKL